MGVETVKQTTSWLQAILSWYLIRLFGKVARGRAPWTSNSVPHDAAGTFPPRLEQHYAVHLSRLVLEDSKHPLEKPPSLPARPQEAHPAPSNTWTQARDAWLAPLAIYPHPPPHHPTASAEAHQQKGARAALSRSGVKRLVLFLHGGGFIYPMSAFHWKFASKLATKLDALVVAQTYTLLPWGGVWDVLPPLLVVYRELQAAASESGAEFIVLGDRCVLYHHSILAKII